MRGDKYLGKVCATHPGLNGQRFRSSSICTRCATERQRRWRTTNPARNRHNALLRKYGITYDQFAVLLEAQGGKCAICLGDKPGGTGDWHVDHDHASSKVRGLLCSPCNTSLGQLNDDPVRFDRAAAYLRSHA